MVVKTIYPGSVDTPLGRHGLTEGEIAEKTKIVHDSNNVNTLFHLAKKSLVEPVAWRHSKSPLLNSMVVANLKVVCREDISSR